MTAGLEQPGFAAIHYCTRCGRRLSRADQAQGAVVTLEGKLFHRACAADGGAAGSAPAAPDEAEAAAVEAVAEPQEADLPRTPGGAGFTPRRRTTSALLAAAGGRKTPAAGVRNLAPHRAEPGGSARTAPSPARTPDGAGKKLVLAAVVLVLLGGLAVWLIQLQSSPAAPPPKAAAQPPAASPAPTPAPAATPPPTPGATPLPAVPLPANLPPPKPAGVSPPPVAAAPGPAVPALDNLKPGHWVEVPGSHLEAVAPNPLPPGNLSAVMGAWNGAAYDTKRDRLLVFGGGNTNYAGNEIYAFDLATLRWSRIWGPTPVEQIPTGKGDHEQYPDGSPGARATYGGLTYLPAQDALYVTSGGLWLSGGSSKKLWLFELGAGRWRLKTAEPADGPGITCDWDPTTGHVFMQVNAGFREYDPVNDRVTERCKTDGGFWNSQTAAAIDPVRRRYVIVGGKKVHSYDLTTYQHSQPQTTGDQTVVLSSHPGFQYDAAAQQFVAWVGGGEVYTLDPATWAWRRVAPAPDNAVLPGAPAKNGTYGRFRYIPSKDCFILVNGVNQNVFFYKLNTPAQ